MNTAEEGRWVSTHEEDYSYLTYTALPEDVNFNLDRVLDSSAFVDALLQTNSRFVFRGTVEDYGPVTLTWNIEGLAEVIGECMAVFD